MTDVVPAVEMLESAKRALVEGSSWTDDIVARAKSLSSLTRELVEALSKAKYKVRVSGREGGGSILTVLRADFQDEAKVCAAILSIAGMTEGTGRPSVRTFHSRGHHAVDVATARSGTIIVGISP